METKSFFSIPTLLAAATVGVVVGVYLVIKGR